MTVSPLNHSLLLYFFILFYFCCPSHHEWGAFSLLVLRGVYILVAVHGLLIAVASHCDSFSLVVEHRLNSCGT